MVLLSYELYTVVFPDVKIVLKLTSQKNTANFKKGE